MASTTVDIFCNVIDNYGDAGVCLHLARSMSKQGYQVRLFCNNLTVLGTISDQADASNQNLEVVSWEQHLTGYTPAQVVISAFSCRFDEVTLKALQEANPMPLIINLEYLSAESWVEDCHTLPSPVDGLLSHYFFPGFTAKTGGLNIDSDFVNTCKARHQELLQHEQMGLSLVTETTTETETSTETTTRTISLFSYLNQALKPLLDALQRSKRPSHIKVFTGLALDNVNALLKDELKTPLEVGQQVQLGKVTFEGMPMLSHEQYDEVLTSCSFNLVRGEDSIVRAIHTGNPYLWQIYIQEEQAHITKLKSFLERMRFICEQEVKKEQGSEAVGNLGLSEAELEKGLVAIERTMLAYNEAMAWPQDFDIDEFESLTAPVFLLFARYLCAQDNLTTRLSRFIQAHTANTK